LNVTILLAVPVLASAAFATWVALRVLVPLAHRYNWLDHPAGRKDHATPTPIVGGLAVVVGSTVAAVVLGAYLDGKPGLLAFAVAAGLLVVVGLLDDLYDIRWPWRIAAQVLAALIMSFGAGVKVAYIGNVFGIPVDGLGWLSVPFTVFITVALINAINMCDGVDGLAGSLVTAALLMLAMAAWYSGNAVLFQHLLTFVAAMAVFLAYNLRTSWQGRARVFLGNAGSMFLGLVIAWATLGLTQNPAHPVTPVLAPFFLVPPIMDSIALIIRRICHGRSPFSADRNHLHHLMLDAGFGPTQVAGLLTLFSFACGGLAALSQRYDWLSISALIVIYTLGTIAWFAYSYRRERAVAGFARLRGWLGGRPEPVAGLGGEPTP
jgi:UDP-GlcNAc:undecaprenyl-phosphate GlcNAc-1-phosphate transferase